jgi:hypothetical protein
MAKTTRKPIPKTAARKPAAKPAVKPAQRRAPAKPKAKAAPAPIQAKAAAKVKVAKSKAKSSPKKAKTVRDSFNMPAADYALIGELKKRALAAAREIKKSELLRAGLKALSTLGDEAFTAALAAVPSIKTGRPKK